MPKTKASTDPTCQPNQQGEFLSTGQAAQQLGIRPQQVQRLYERGFLPASPRAGLRRIIPVGDLPKLEEAARRAGYLA